MPALPNRYADLALPYDWFLPGKEQRRKRKHRKSHGAIGFHELSRRVSAAWEAAGADAVAVATDEEVTPLGEDDLQATARATKLPVMVMDCVMVRV